MMAMRTPSARIRIMSSKGLSGLWVEMVEVREPWMRDRRILVLECGMRGVWIRGEWRKCADITVEY